MLIYNNVKLKTLNKFLTLIHWNMTHRGIGPNIDEIKEILECSTTTAYRYNKAISELSLMIRRRFIRIGGPEFLLLTKPQTTQTTQTSLAEEDT